MSVPALVIAFNRPALTAALLDTLRHPSISEVFVVVDGPRRDHPTDTDRCREVRLAVEAHRLEVPVTTWFRDDNLGCARGVPAAIDWFFDQVDHGIILEDDCHPRPDYLRFADELLHRHRDDRRVMSVTGSTFLRTRDIRPDTYRFTRFVHIWGWATWKRAWELYDADMTDWPELRSTGWLTDACRGNPEAASYWADLFDRTSTGKIDTWDFQWFYSCWRHEGLAAVPPFNLVDNRGFGVEATNVHHAPRWYLRSPRGELRFPLRPPERVAPDLEAEGWLDEQVFRRGSQRSQRAKTAVRRGVDGLGLGATYDRLRRWIP